MTTNDIISWIVSGKPLSQDLINEIVIALTSYQNLGVNQEANIEVMRARIAQMTPYLKQYDSLVSQVAELTESLSTYQNAWHNTLKNEINNSPTYALPRAKSDPQGVFDLLMLPNIKATPDPVPISVCVDNFSKIILDAHFSNLLTDAVKGRWLNALQAELTLLTQSHLATLPRATLEQIRAYAVSAGIIKPDYQIGVLMINKLTQLGIESFVTKPYHVSLAMGW